MVILKFERLGGSRRVGHCAAILVLLWVWNTVLLLLLL
jgi:hypothetical protein